MREVDGNKGAFRRHLLDDHSISDAMSRELHIRRVSRRGRKLTDRKDRRVHQPKPREADPTIHAKEVLDNLVDWERLDQSRGEIPLIGYRSEDLINSYRASHMAIQSLGLAINALRLNPGKQEAVRSHFVGKVFQDLGYGVLSRQNSEDRVLLSPGRSQQFLEALFPGAPIIEKSSDVGMRRFKSPELYSADGLVVDTSGTHPRVIGFVEYSAATNTQARKEQIEKAKRMAAKFPSLFSNPPEFVLVGPKGWEPRKSLRPMLTEFRQLPVDRRALHYHTNSLWNTVEGIASRPALIV